MGCVSSQETYETSFLESVEINTTENIVYAKQPSYKELIPPAAARRMAKGVKMGLAASQARLLLLTARKNDVEAQMMSI